MCVGPEQQEEQRKLMEQTRAYRRAQLWPVESHTEQEEYYKQEDAVRTTVVATTQTGEFAGTATHNLYTLIVSFIP